MSELFGDMFDELFDFNNDGQLDLEEQLVKTSFIQQYFDEDDSEDDEEE